MYICIYNTHRINFDVSVLLMTSFKMMMHTSGAATIHVYVHTSNKHASKLSQHHCSMGVWARMHAACPHVFMHPMCHSEEVEGKDARHNGRETAHGEARVAAFA